MIVTLAASWLVASKNEKKRNWGCWAFLLSNALWITWGIGADLRWTKLLNKERNTLIHQSAPWPAIRIDDRGRFEIVLLKKNLDDTAGYTTLADNSSIYDGFTTTSDMIEAWLFDEIATFGTAAPMEL